MGASVEGTGYGHSRQRPGMLSVAPHQCTPACRRAVTMGRGRRGSYRSWQKPLPRGRQLQLPGSSPEWP